MVELDRELRVYLISAPVSAGRKFKQTFFQRLENEMRGTAYPRPEISAKDFSRITVGNL